MKKVLIKLSGEFFLAPNQPVSATKALDVAKEIKSLYQQKVKIAVVVGAGNIVRGSKIKNLSRLTVDYAGMCAAEVNGLMLQAALQALSIPSVLYSSLHLSKIAQPFNLEMAKEDFLGKKVVIFGSTGLPYVTTDTAAVLFAISLGIEEMYKLTKVDGVYESDPKKSKSAKRFSSLSYDEVLQKRLNVMDMTAFALARENGLTIKVGKWTKGSLIRLWRNKNYGTIIKNK